MFGFSGEHLIILLFILLIFGPRRLPETGRSIGKAIRNFKDSFAGIQEPQFRRLHDLDDHEPSLKDSKVDATAQSENSRPS